MHKLSAYVIVHRTQSNQTADGIRLDGERNPIGWRTESDWTADGNRLDGERKRQGVQLSQLHQPSQQNNLFQLSPLGFAACQRKNCTNQANDTNVGGYGILAVVTQPSVPISFH